MAKRLDSATRSRRLIALLPHLKRNQTIPLAELAAAVGCTPAEVATDLSMLTLCGVPPFSPIDLIDLQIDGDHVIVHMDPPGLDRPLRLTAPEARALGAALDAAGYPQDSDLRHKVREAAAHDVPADELERTVRAGAAPGGMADLYSTLAAAADDHKKVEVTYLTGSTGRISSRVVHPWALVNRHGVWYLVGYCEGAGEERVFRLDRMSTVRPTGEHFEPPTSVPETVTPDPERLAVAEIKFSPGAVPPDERAWPGATSALAEDGATIVRLPYQSASWVARRVAARLGDAEVIGPAEVRAAVRRLATTVLAETR